MLIKRANRETGSILVIVAVFMVALFGFAALSIDVAQVFQQQRAAQIGVDSSALAGVVLLTNQVQDAASVALESRVVANTNGVTTAEITASSIGAVQVGYWDTNAASFTANATGPDGRWNSVRVPAKRTVNMVFGKVVGISTMTPAVKSVALVAGANNVAGLIPFGIATNLLAGKDFVTNNIVVVDQYGSGNWGKVELCDLAMNGGNFGNYIPDGVPCAETVGRVVSSQPGNSSGGMNNEMSSLVGLVRGFPVVDAFGSGKKDVTIMGFVLAKVLSVSGNGSHFTMTVQLVPGFVGGGGGGPGQPPFANSRVLVQ